MTDLKIALYKFWSQFGVPAYLTDCVPDDAELPYILYDTQSADFGGVTFLTAYNWHRRAPDGNVMRSAMMDRIAEAIPIGGVMIPVGDGYMTLHRNDNFQMDWQDPNDPDVIGGRTSYELRIYNP